MKHLNKILALTIIATFLLSIPIALAKNEPQLVKVVCDIRVDTQNGKPDNPGGGGGGGTGTKGPTGYSLTGVSWKTTPVSIVVDPVSAGANGVNSLFFKAVSDSVATWDSATTKQLTNPVTLGASELSTESDVPDELNEIMYGDLASTRIIAQTTYWYNPSTGEIVDFDIVFNTYFQWGDATKDPALMDIQNIATHEFGHGFGLGDLYQLKYSALTMYGYASEGQYNKRTLESGDIAGIRAIYGL